MFSSETKQNNLTRAEIKSSDKFFYFFFIRQCNTAHHTKNNNVLSKDRMVILCLLFGSIQPQQPLWQLLHMLGALLITQACAPFMPSSSRTILPFQTQGNTESCLNGCSVFCTKAMSTSLSAAVQLLDMNSREYMPYTSLEGCAFGQLLALRGALADLRNLQMHCGQQDALSYRLFLCELIVRVYVTADFQWLACR